MVPAKANIFGRRVDHGQVSAGLHESSESGRPDAALGFRSVSSGQRRGRSESNDPPESCRHCHELYEP